MSRKVVVTGLGAITPIGGNVQETWKNALQGVSGVHALEEDWVEEYDLPVRIGAQCPKPAEDVVSRVQAKRLDPSGQLSVAAAREAWTDAGFSGKDADSSDDVDPLRLGVAFGTGIGGVWTLLDGWDTMRTKGHRRVKPMTVPMLMPNGNASSVSMEFKARACAITPVSACASGTEAFFQGLQLIRSGKADVMIVGGAESAIHPMNMAAFNSMQALSRRNDEPERASRPFDMDRDGFVMGEGAGAVILESEEHAKARGARIYAELAGAGLSSDAFHITAPATGEAGGPARALREAMESGDFTPADVKHVNAHATSTPVGDVPEASALRVAFGDAVDQMAVSATKSMTGHLLGGSGAVEGVLAVLALTERLAPCTINLENQDPRIDLDVVTTARELPTGDMVAISNSFGFGGHNSVAAFRSV
ncbi:MULTISPECIES: beta-ketoacyl-[acyl-carrier-protein] synthase family protein [Kocuria]|uniref:beta-ketoacyl-[acyl-carrier-protein] synthase family protein n=1 Tax=Kocuria TaxID=57493 RepID=UPI0008A17537|nr:MULTISPECIES: beta-ketoacyl-[acyl-carrier-protein] synthase family protein [Kocuria]MCT1958161.1 beta-ketoacyl-[acyl-carrier-protein] synthase family protein [Kocuria rhizophila]MCT2072622.1 beta-ketoacyl-[acyl-carrier-protein] synthase family protein [Kocuria rhizophila]OFK07308.1 beta-ketoacyl-[acyl-carrier-protein] synthase II [Kocuria sp. HMSC066H03]PKZ38934.1 beta-ketoacyl-[acyl-carrier-protein] synthase family protein [Kocuria rhizophila]PMR90590.1 beta-ketoacyl-[acyl-carrier-protein]